MAGGANNVGSRFTPSVVNGTQIEGSSNSSSTTFQKVLGKASGDPKSSFLGLGKVLQNTQLSAGERQVACQRVITEVLGPKHPYQALAKDQSFMSAVSSLMADDPRLGAMVERYRSGKV